MNASDFVIFVIFVNFVFFNVTMQYWLCNLTVTKLTVQSSIASYYFMSVTYLHTEPLLEVLSDLIRG